MEKKEVRAIIMMGVSGSGKTLIGKMLAKALNIKFVEGDDLHPPSNVHKMQSGIPLTDEDRWPWLEKIKSVLQQTTIDKKQIVLSCSTLKSEYRQHLRQAGNITFLYLEVPKSILKKRLAQRTHHFMPPALLTSQLNTLEIPQAAETDVIWIDAKKSPQEVVEKCVLKLKEHQG